MDMRLQEAKKHKGFWIRCHTIDGNIRDITGFRSLPDIEMAIKKYGPQIIKIEAHIGVKLIKTFIREGKTMGKFASFAAENPSQGGFAPFCSSQEKEALCAFKVPFEIKSFKTVESTKFKNDDGSPQTSIWYNIDLDTTSDSYQFAQKVGNMQPSYTLQLPDSPRRQKQIADIIRPEIEDHGGCLVCLKKIGKGYDFGDVE